MRLVEGNMVNGVGVSFAVFLVTMAFEAEIVFGNVLALFLEVHLLDGTSAFDATDCKTCSVSEGADGTCLIFKWRLT